MPKRRPPIVTTRPAAVADAPAGLLADAQPSAAILGENFRRVALGLCAALVVSRAYWPAEFRDESESGSSLTWSLAMLASALIAATGAWLTGGLRLRKSWADLGVMALFALVALSARHALDRRVAINLGWEWLAVGVGYVLLRNLPRSRGESSALSAALVATAAAVSAYGLFQIAVELPRARVLFATSPREALARAGLDPNMTGPSLARFQNRLMGSREPVSTFALTNTLAGVIVGPLVVGLVLLLRRDPRKAQEELHVDSISGWMPRASAGSVAFLLLVCLLLTKSRSAYLGLFSALGVFAFRQRRAARPRTIALTALGGLIGLAVVVFVAWMSWQVDRKIITEAAKSLSYRADYWRGAWAVIADEPGRWFSGLGPGNFAAPYLRHKPPLASEEIADPHNLLLEVWATAGLPALLALLAGLAYGLRATLGPAKAVADLPSAEEEAPSPRSSGWLAVTAGLGGLAAVVALGKLNPMADESLVRLMILGIAWGLSAAMLYPLLSRSPMPPEALGLGALAVAVNLLAAGGIGFAPVSLMLWGQLALGQDLRADRPCSARRPIDGRALAFAACAVLAALIGTFLGTVLPYWRAESAILDAEAALTGPTADVKRADALYQRAAEDDAYGSRARIARANLEMLEWRRRGRPAEEMTWHRVNSGLKSAAEPPRNPDSLFVQRLRAQWALEFLSVPGQVRAERNTLRADRVDATRRACTLYPTDAALRADFAVALADIGNFREAVRQAMLALKQDAITPHADKKLESPVRELLFRKAAAWAFSTM